MSEQVVSLGELSRVERKPGDVFVLHAKDVLSPIEQWDIRKLFEEQFGEDCKVLIVPHGLKLSLVNKMEFAEC